MSKIKVPSIYLNTARKKAIRISAGQIFLMTKTDYVPACTEYSAYVAALVLANYQTAVSTGLDCIEGVTPELYIANGAVGIYFSTGTEKTHNAHGHFPIRVPHPYGYSRFCVAITDTEFQRLDELYARIYNAQALGHVLRSKITDLLRLVNTSKQLLEIWPEGAIHIPTVPVAEVTVHLGVELAKDLNELLIESGVEIDE
jgi:hypothetical protein